MILYKKAQGGTKTKANSPFNNVSGVQGGNLHRDLMLNARNKGMGDPLLWDAATNSTSALTHDATGIDVMPNTTEEDYNYALLDANTHGLTKPDFIKNYRRYKAGTMPENAIPNFEILMRRNPAWIPNDTIQ